MADSQGGTSSGPSFGVRMRYKFDNTLTRGPLAIIMWLAMFSFVLILLTAFVITIFRFRFEEGRHITLLEAFWQTMLRTLDPGTFSGDAGWGLRLATFFITIMGLLIVSALIGVIATGLDTKIDELRKGRSFVVESGHTVILGWSSRIFKIVSEIVVANENHAGLAIVVLAEEDKTFMEDELKDRAGPLGRTKVVCRTGDPSSIHDLEIVNIDAARSIIVLGGEGSAGDAEAIKTVLAVRAKGGLLDRVPVVAEFSDTNSARALKRACDGKVLTVQSADVVARVIAQACRQSGLSLVFQELLDFDGDEIYFQPAPEMVGHTYGEALLAYDTSSIIGRMTADGTVQVNPPIDTVFESGDRVIAISEDDDTVVFSGFQGNGSSATPPAPAPPGEVERIMVIGWNQLAPRVLLALDEFVTAGSSVLVHVDEEQVDPANLYLPALENLQVNVTTGGTGDDLGDVVASDEFTSVMILGYRRDLSPEEADARTLLTLLLLERALDEGANSRRPRVVAELLDARDVELARVTGADDFVVSDALASLMMAQLSEHGELDQVFSELFDADGSAVHMKDAANYVQPGTAATFREIVAGAAARRETAIGYRRASGANGEPEVIVNPRKADTISLGADDHVIVIGSN